MWRLTIHFFVMNWPSHYRPDQCARPEPNDASTKCSVRYCHHAAESGRKHPFWQDVIDCWHIQTKNACSKATWWQVNLPKWLFRDVSTAEDKALTGSQTWKSKWYEPPFCGSICSALASLHPGSVVWLKAEPLDRQIAYIGNNLLCECFPFTTQRIKGESEHTVRTEEGTYGLWYPLCCPCSLWARWKMQGMSCPP